MHPITDLQIDDVLVQLVVKSHGRLALLLKPPFPAWLRMTLRLLRLLDRVRKRQRRVLIKSAMPALKGRRCCCPTNDRLGMPVPVLIRKVKLAELNQRCADVLMVVVMVLGCHCLFRHWRMVTSAHCILDLW